MSDRRDDNPDKPVFINANRRGFLQGAAVAGGAAASGTVAAATDVDITADTTASSGETNGKGYQLTDHIKKYYKRARF